MSVVRWITGRLRIERVSLRFLVLHLSFRVQSLILVFCRLLQSAFNVHSLERCTVFSLTWFLYYWYTLDIGHSFHIREVSRNTGGEIIDEGTLLRDVNRNDNGSQYCLRSDRQTDRVYLHDHQNRPTDQLHHHIRRFARKNQSYSAHIGHIEEEISKFESKIHVFKSTSGYLLDSSLWKYLYSTNHNTRSRNR